MIEVKGLTKRYGSFCAVDHLDFSVENGKIYGFLGPNGAGKSTTMNMITGCLASTEGTVLIDGHDILEEPEEAKRLIGYLPEIPPLYPDMTPYEYLFFVARAKGIAKSDLISEVEEAMNETGVTRVKDRLIKNLSKGYKQRVGIAQALIGKPELIILDEPTVGLDPKQIIGIRDLIRELGKTRTVMISSHILAEISEICDMVMIINHGRLVASDTIPGIKAKYKDVSKILLSVRATEEKTSELLSAIDGVLSYEFAEPEEEGMTDAVVMTDGREGLREMVTKVFVSEGIGVGRITAGAQSLEEIFIGLTSDSSAENADADSEDGEESEPECEIADQSEPETDGEEYTPLFSAREEKKEDE